MARLGGFPDDAAVLAVDADTVAALERLLGSQGGEPSRPALQAPQALANAALTESDQAVTQAPDLEPRAGHPLRGYVPSVRQAPPDLLERAFPLAPDLARISLS